MTINISTERKDTTIRFARNLVTLNLELTFRFTRLMFLDPANSDFNQFFSSIFLHTILKINSINFNPTSFSLAEEIMNWTVDLIEARNCSTKSF